MRWALLLPAVVAAAACGRSGAPESERPHVPTPRVDPSGVTPTPTPVGLFCEDPDVFGCWRFEDDTVDESPRAVVMSSGGIDFDSDGAVGEAVELDATSFMTMPGTAAWVEQTSPLSFELWLNPDVLPGSGERFGLIDRANGGGYSLFLYPNGTIRCGSRVQVYASNAVAVDTWTHVACVDDTATTEVWIDGVLEGAAAGAGPLVMTTSGQKVYFGENGPDGNDQFLGLLDEIRFVSRALTTAEIQASVERLE